MLLTDDRPISILSFLSNYNDIVNGINDNIRGHNEAGEQKSIEPELLLSFTIKDAVISFLITITSNLVSKKC